MALTIPLSAAFAGQCILIAAAFTAVILILTERQRTEFQSAIEDKIHLQQMNANHSVLLPFLTREEPFKQLARKMLNKPSLQVNDNSSLQAMLPFFDAIFMMVKDDELVTNVGQIGLSDSFVHANGDRYWSMVGVSEDLWATVVKNGIAYVAVQNDYPISLAFTVQQSYDITYDPMVDNTAANFTQWMRSRAFMNPFTGTISFSITMASPLAWHPTTGKVTGTALMTVSLAGIKDTIASQLVSLSTSAILISVDRQDVWVSTDPNVAQYDPSDTSWTVDNFPGRKQINQYQEAASACPSPACSFKILEIGKDIVSIVNIRTPTMLNLHLMQSTPRSYFYSASDRNRMIGIIVGVVAAVAVVAMSIWISIAIHRPLSRLQISMGLASVMKNQEAEESSGSLSILSEVSQIQNSFLSMNKRLLLARPFLPQSLLLVDDILDLDSDDEGNCQDLAHEQRSDQCRSACESPADAGIGPVSPACSVYSKGRSNVAGRASRRASVSLQAPLHSIPMAKHETLGTRRVAILMVNLRGFHALTSGTNIDSLGTCVRSLCGMVEAVVLADKGIVDAFHGDHFTVTYNVARTIGNPGQAAAMSATRLRSDLRNLPEFSKQSLSMGLAVGKATVGNLGSDTMKKLCVVGPVFSEAVSLERLASTVNQDCVVLERCLDGIESVAYTFVVGMLSTTHGPSPRFEAVRSLMEAVETCASDEWMYEVRTHKDVDPYAMLNDAMRAYLAGDLDMARVGLAKATGQGNMSFSLSMSTGPQLVGLSASIMSPKADNGVLGSASTVSKEFYEVSNRCSSSSPILQSLSNNIGVDEGIQKQPADISNEPNFHKTKRLLWAAERLSRLVNSGIGKGYYDAHKMACPTPEAYER
eukprot:GILI01010970.1.p1 GENE.GILI01010970.1~~GILI01010970.1.p1  ORF type:complete len:872 (-),score=160.25 GILI01010970.1:291-2906(-)